ncbi:hypothetical protein FC093_13820 [Ilyomonas limi]|uniref:Transposase n=1 Tax=Ilyomonas limi TaxID=2575867 RepID=A0A4U3L1Q5_9BACT|nr:hypothetical protein [Ilyomonas limi]TKK67377.1 hypothetical protein FC093_13820 [Ilyomonas limi]
MRWGEHQGKQRFKCKSCLLAYQDGLDGHTQLIRVSDEKHHKEIKEDPDNLIRLGVHLESITADGLKSILKVIKRSLPDVNVQRMLIHIQRMCLLWLTRYPEHASGQELRSLVLVLLKIKTQNNKLFWIRELNNQKVVDDTGISKGQLYEKGFKKFISKMMKVQIKTVP